MISRNAIARDKVGDVEVKEKLAKAINTFLEPIREKRAYYLAHPTIPRDVLANGIRRMQTEAKETMKLVRDVTGLSYSLDLFADEVDIFGELKNNKIARQRSTD